MGLFGIFKIFPLMNYFVFHKLDMADVLDFVLKVFEETEPLGDNFMAQLEQTTRVSIEPCITISGILFTSPSFGTHCVVRFV